MTLFYSSVPVSHDPDTEVEIIIVINFLDFPNGTNVFQTKGLFKSCNHSFTHSFPKPPESNVNVTTKGLTHYVKVN